MKTDSTLRNFLDRLVSQLRSSPIYYTMLSFAIALILSILANKASTAREPLGRLQLAYENLPKWMQHGILVWNKGNVELENGSKILKRFYVCKCCPEVCPLISSFLTSSRSSRITLLSNSLPLFILLLRLVNQRK